MHIQVFFLPTQKEDLQKHYRFINLIVRGTYTVGSFFVFLILTTLLTVTLIEMGKNEMGAGERKRDGGRGKGRETEMRK